MVEKKVAGWVRTTIRLPEGLHAAVKHKAIDQRSSFQAVVIFALAQYVAGGKQQLIKQLIEGGQ